MKWSVDGQTPLLLEVTRMVNLSSDVMDIVMSRLQLASGMRVLELGCGTGEYSFRLAQRLEGVEFVGLDFDDEFIRIANEKVLEQDCKNSFTFLQGDGCCLPFADDEFDAVVSHTYLTAVPDYKQALSEMVRVCKPEGQVSSVTVMGPKFEFFGRFSLLPQYRFMEERDSYLVERVVSLSLKLPSMDMGSGIPTWDVQNCFAQAGLQRVGAAPIGQYFCLSDAQVDSADYRRFVELLYQLELLAVQRLQDNADVVGSLPAVEWMRYEDYLTRRRDYLLSVEGCNPEWDWYGSAALLVFGNKRRAA